MLASSKKNILVLSEVNTCVIFQLFKNSRQIMLFGNLMCSTKEFKESFRLAK
jgi:hypothetical protein